MSTAGGRPGTEETVPTAEGHVALRVRDLRFGAAEAWPPTWRALPGRPLAAGEDGVLSRARVRSHRSVMIHIAADGVEHEGLLVWDGPPSPTVLVDVLNRAAGKTIRDIADLLLPGSALTTKR